jgi:hypothetical protein
LTLLTVFREIELPGFEVGRVDGVFALGFVLVLAGGSLMFLSSVAWIVLSSMVGMFFGFFSMVLCLGMDDL